MAICRDCGWDMTAGVDCTAFPRRAPHDGDQPCHDCRTPVGGLHHPGCDDERCEHGCQAIGDCPDCDDAKHVPECERNFYDPDTGEWTDCEGCKPGRLDYWERHA